MSALPPAAIAMVVVAYVVVIGLLEYAKHRHRREGPEEVGG